MPHPVEEGGGAPSFRPLWALMPYLWPKDLALRARVFASIACLILAILATTYYPVVLKQITDELSHTPATIAMAITFGLVGAFVLARILMQAFAQLRDGIFAKVQYHAMREVGVETFAHVHTLSRVIERGTKGIDTLLSFALFSIFPTAFQLILFSALMVEQLDWTAALVTIAMVVAYSWFTFAVTRWRIAFRREMNQSDTDANTKAVDSLLNYETVKYFNNEAHETTR